MSELIVLLLKLGFLVALWLFILFVGNVIRTDLFGRKLSPAELAATGAPVERPAPSLSKRDERKLPRNLKVTHGPQAGTALKLGQPILIGRAQDCQLVLLDDDYVSTRHARVFLGEGGYFVEDLGSTNGTFVNNQRIGVPTPLTPADTLRIGRTLIVLEK